MILGNLHLSFIIIERVLFSLDLMCDQYYFGHDCSKNCQPYLQQYNCDNNGNKVCLQGKIIVYSFQNIMLGDHPFNFCLLRGAAEKTVVKLFYSKKNKKL